MTTLNLNATLGQLVAEKPSLSRTFEELGIDYCCGGKKTLTEACQEKGLDTNTLVKVLEATSSQGDAPAFDCDTMSLTELVDHIESVHHDHLRTELPRLSRMVNKVKDVHGRNRPDLVELATVYNALHQELEQHMMKEEQVLFPFVREIDQSEAFPCFHCGSVTNPIKVMEMEHDNAGIALGAMRELTNDYQPPEGACNTWLAMLDGLRELEEDMHQHVHKENNILFPKVSAAEAAAEKKTCST